MSKRIQNMQKIVEILLAQNNEFDTNAAKTVQDCITAIENDDINSDNIQSFIRFAHPKGLGDRYIDAPDINSYEAWTDLVYAAKEDARQEYLRILSQTKQKIVQETGRKTANKDIRILYQDAFCKCGVNTLADETIFTTTITGEELTYNLSGHHYGPHMFFNCIDDSKSFDLYGQIWFPGSVNSSITEWKRFCYEAMADVIINDIKDKRLYKLPDSLNTYIEAVNIMFDESFIVECESHNSGMFPPAGGFIINDYNLIRQGSCLKKGLCDYNISYQEIIKNILFEITKII